MKKKMEKALNKQVNAEFYSSYLYLAMESYFQSISLSGCARWMRGQVQEEMFHGMKIYDYIHERGGGYSLRPSPSLRLSGSRLWPPLNIFWPMRRR